MISPTSLLPIGGANPDFVGRIRRGKQYRSLGALGVLGSVLAFVAANLISQAGGTLAAVLLTLFLASLALIGWAQLWFKESKEPFQYTYSIGEFVPVPGSSGAAAAGGEDDPLAWLSHDLKEKLSERVPRLSLLEADVVPEAEPDDDPASHVHISGWLGFRRDDQGCEFEVVPEVRLGGKGAPARLARPVRLRLDEGSAEGTVSPEGSLRLTEDGYAMLFERVYWSVASQIYTQIQRGVEEKVKLLPRGSLRAAAYVHEGDDYATSNTLDAYAAAQDLYRRALEIYEVRYRRTAATPWRKRATDFLSWLTAVRRWARSRRAMIWRRSGRRELMTARAELGLAQMLTAESHLGKLCGVGRKDIYEAPDFVDHAVERLTDLPMDVPERNETLFRAYVIRATIKLLLSDFPGAREALADAERLLPTRTREDAEYLFAAGMAEPNRLPSLRLYGQAVELDPTMERAIYHKAERYDEIWRQQDPPEAETGLIVDAGYRAVTALNPGNLAAWGRRGFVGWLLAEEESEGSDWWRAHAISALQTGRQYKEVRRDASVAELDWNLARLAAEEGDFDSAYRHYIDAVSARLADPRIDFESNFYLSPTQALVDRFWRYQRVVMTKAEQAEREGTFPLRMIKSVKAFVLNDCGLAYHAHYDRTGREKSLVRAWGAIEAARRENEAFVLPTLNLARLYLEMTEMPERSREENQEALRKAIELTEDVLRREPNWAPAQLLMVKAQRAMASLLAAKQAEAEASSARDAGEAETDAPVRPAQSDRFDEERDICFEEAVAQLRALLPHDQLRENHDSHVVDAAGSRVEALLSDEKVRWAKDFNVFHVYALAEWGAVLAATNPVAGSRLCAKLRKTYSAGDGALLGAHFAAASAIAERDPGNRAAIAARDECMEIFQKTIGFALQEDPVHLVFLKVTPLLPEEERRRALDAALAAGPSATALIWIGDYQTELGDRERAIASFELARRRGRKSIAPVAGLKLARLLEAEEGRESEALDAYRVATKAREAAIAAEGAAGVGRLLIAAGDPAGARDAMLRAARREGVAEHLASRLREEGRAEGGILVLREALEQTAEGEDRRAELQMALAIQLANSEIGDSVEPLALLTEVAASDTRPVRWQAKLILAEYYVESEPEKAEPLYEEIVAQESDPTPVAIGVWSLSLRLEKAGDAEGAAGLRLSHARANPTVAAQLAEFKRQRGDADVEAFLASAAEPAAEPVSAPLAAAGQS